MEVHRPLISYMEKVILDHSIISVSGESGTGKTSFVLYLVGTIIEDPSCCVWIQASEPFPKARMTSLFGEKKEKMEYLLQNVFIIPTRPFRSYGEQSDFFHTFVADDSLFPPDLRFIVIDNISHHLRYDLSTKAEIKEKVQRMDTFYESNLSPLILKCQREGVILILIHEVTFDVANQRTRPFFYKLYDRIKSLHITINKSLYTKERTMDIETGNKVVSLGFTLSDNGFYLV